MLSFSARNGEPSLAALFVVVWCCLCVGVIWRCGLTAVEPAAGPPCPFCHSIFIIEPRCHYNPVKAFKLLGQELRLVALEVNACCSSSDVGVDGRHDENEGVDGEEGGDGSFLALLCWLRMDLSTSSTPLPSL